MCYQSCYWISDLKHRFRKALLKRTQHFDATYCSFVVITCFLRLATVLECVARCCLKLGFSKVKLTIYFVLSGWMTFPFPLFLSRMPYFSWGISSRRSWEKLLKIPKVHQPRLINDIQLPADRVKFAGNTMPNIRYMVHEKCNCPQLLYTSLSW